MGGGSEIGKRVPLPKWLNTPRCLTSALAAALACSRLASPRGSPSAPWRALASLQVAFIGRSNVGKSSLVNMVCNRRALAYTSKTPGKTQQFNYFLVNNQSKWDPAGKFHLVDLPGLGYAKVPQHVREMWIKFMSEYFYERQELKLIFHLVDSRHGPAQTDLDIMQMMSKLPARVGYVVVLTKADKKESEYKAEGVRRALREAGCEQGTPIVFTSSVTNKGREAMWRF